MTAETCPGAPPSTITPEGDVVKLRPSQCSVVIERPSSIGQNSNNNNVSRQCPLDGTNCQQSLQYSYKQEYACMEDWLDEHPDFVHDYFIR